MLVLPIKKQWFDMIIAREKLEEYRNITPYYQSRFKNLFSMFPYSAIPIGLDNQEIILRNGYSKKSPTCKITATLDIGQGKEQWGADQNKEYYILKINDVILQ